MQPETLKRLAERAETASVADETFVADLLAALRRACPEVAEEGLIRHEVLASTEAALGLVDRVLPGWRIQLVRGRSWHCSLREPGIGDDDAVVGIGGGTSVPISLVIALLGVASVRRARA
jgi:hypothetical protein